MTDRPQLDESQKDNPIMDFARAINDAPSLADAPFTLTPEPTLTQQEPSQASLFDQIGKDDHQ